MRDAIFISYSHHNENWRTIFEKALKIGVYAGVYEILSDKDIAIGSNWQKRIAEYIARSRIALLLVTQEFLESEFIVARELIAILNRHEVGGLKVHWVPIDPIQDQKLELANLKSLEAASNPKRPLATLEKAECAEIVEQICNKIIADLRLIADTGQDTRNDLKTEVAAAVGANVGVNVVIEKAIAAGDFSVVYKARQRKHIPVAIKVVMPSVRLEWLKDDFIQRASSTRDLSDPCFIKILDTVSHGRIHCVIMEFIKAPTLETLLKRSPEGRLPYTDVADILSQLTAAADSLHSAAGGQADLTPFLMGPLRPSHVYRDTRGKVRVSPVHISHETIQSCRKRPTLVLERDELTCLSPERYRGEKITWSSDQYHLALLGIELLFGKPPVIVEHFVDLKRKEAFFDAPTVFFGDLRSSSPALSFVLTKMLERKPEDRWPTMMEASTALRQVAQGLLPSQVRRSAMANYSQFLKDNTAFFEAFYSRLFEIAPDVRMMFIKTSMNQQYEKINRAMVALLNFIEEVEPNSLHWHTERHKAFGLKAQHFEAFRDAFLKALADLPNGVDQYSLDAWRAVLDAGLKYMASRICHVGSLSTL